MRKKERTQRSNEKERMRKNMKVKGRIRISWRKSKNSFKSERHTERKRKKGFVRVGEKGQ